MYRAGSTILAQIPSQLWIIAAGFCLSCGGTRRSKIKGLMAICILALFAIDNKCTNSSLGLKSIESVSYGLDQFTNHLSASLPVAFTTMAGNVYMSVEDLFFNEAFPEDCLAEQNPVPAANQREDAGPARLAREGADSPV